MRDHGWAAYCMVIIDLRPLNCELEVLDVADGSSALDIVSMLGPECSLSCSTAEASILPKQ